MKTTIEIDIDSVIELLTKLSKAEIIAQWNRSALNSEC